MAAQFSVESAADAAAKKLENGVSASQPDCISSVIPGWFSEISSMWPGEFLVSNLIFSSFCLCLAVEIR